MTYRLLPQKDWCRLTPDFRVRGVELPPDGSRIAVAEDDDGRIAAFHVLQWVPHAEPMLIRKDCADQVYWPTLLHLLEAEVHGGSVYAFAPDERIAAFATVAGYQSRDWRVFEKKVG